METRAVMRRLPRRRLRVGKAAFWRGKQLEMVLCSQIVLFSAVKWSAG